MSRQARRLSLVDTVLFVMGGIVGVGIFFTPSTVADRLSEPWAFLAVWVFGGLVALCAAFTFAELGASFPKAGGWFVFLREAFGAFPAFLFAWVVLFVVSTGATAAMLVFCVEMLHRGLPEVFAVPGSRASKLVAAGITVVVTLVAMSGTRRGAWLQNVCMVTKLALLAGLSLVGFFFVTGAAPRVADVTAIVSTSEAPALLSGFVASLLPVFFSYGGWQMICYIAPEVERPERNLPRAIVVGLVGVVATYLIFNLAALRAIGLEGMAADAGFAATLARSGAGPWGERVVAIGMAVSALGVCAVTIIGTPWLYVAMSRERLFFQAFGRLHPGTGTPILALGVQAAVTLVYLSFASLSFLVDSVVFVEWIFHGLAAWALLRLRRRAGVPRPFRSPLYPLPTVLYLVAALLVVFGTLWQADWKLKGTGVTIVLIGALVYRPWSSWFARRNPAGPPGPRAPNG